MLPARLEEGFGTQPVWIAAWEGSTAGSSVSGGVGVNMANSIGIFRALWRSIVNQIVQDVPQGIEFCEFECTRKQCTLELTGSCDIRPQPQLVLIRPAGMTMSPEWAGGPPRGVLVKPAHVA